MAKKPRTKSSETVTLLRRALKLAREDSRKTFVVVMIEKNESATAAHAGPASRVALAACMHHVAGKFSWGLGAVGDFTQPALTDKTLAWAAANLRLRLDKRSRK